MQHRIAGAVQAVAGIVRHAAVHDGIALIAGDALDAADRVDGHTRVRHDAPPRLHEEARQAQPVFGRPLFQIGGHLAQTGGNVDGRVALLIAHAVAAAQVQFVELQAQLVLDLAHKGEHDIDGALVDVLPEDHGAHVAVQARHLHMLHAQRGPHELHRLAGLHRDAELHVHRPGVHGLIGMGIDARRDAQEDLLPDTARGRFLLQRDQLVAVIHHKAAHALRQRVGDIRVGLAVAVVIDLLRREPRLQCRMDLPHGDAVHAQALLGHDAVHLLETGRLAGIERQRPVPEMRPEGLPVHAAVGADAALIHQIEGRAIASGQFRHGLPRKAERPVAAACDVVCEHRNHLFG